MVLMVDADTSGYSHVKGASSVRSPATEFLSTQCSCLALGSDFDYAAIQVLQFSSMSQESAIETHSCHTLSEVFDLRYAFIPYGAYGLQRSPAAASPVPGASAQASSVVKRPAAAAAASGELPGWVAADLCTIAGIF